MAETEYQRMRRERAARRDGRDEPAPSGRRRRRLSKEERQARASERNRRNTEARRRAFSVLAARYPVEFTELLDAERKGIDAERGPLPGDEE